MLSQVDFFASLSKLIGDEIHSSETAPDLKICLKYCMVDQRKEETDVGGIIRPTNLLN